MKEKRYLILIVFLIILYFLLSFFVIKPNYIIFSNHVYKITKNDIKIISNKKIDNKKIKIYRKEGVISDGYYRNINKDNESSLLYDKDNVKIPNNQYYYAYYGDIDTIKFKERDVINKDDYSVIKNLIKEKSLDYDLNTVNYIKTITFENESLIFIGNFNDDKYFSKYTGSDDEKFFELVVYKDYKDNYKIIKNISAKGKEITNKDFLLFKFIVNSKHDTYYLCLEELNYSFIDGNLENLYELTSTGLEKIK